MTGHQVAMGIFAFIVVVFAMGYASHSGEHRARWSALCRSKGHLCESGKSEWVVSASGDDFCVCATKATR